MEFWSLWTAQCQDDKTTSHSVSHTRARLKTSSSDLKMDVSEETCSYQCANEIIGYFFFFLALFPLCQQAVDQQPHQCKVMNVPFLLICSQCEYITGAMYHSISLQHSKPECQRTEAKVNKNIFAKCVLKTDFIVTSHKSN